MKANKNLMLVNDKTGEILRPALQIEVDLIKATRYGIALITLRCGCVPCRLLVVEGVC